MPFDGVLTLSPAMLLRLKAAAILETNGWCQNAYYTGTRHCLVGALFKAGGLHLYAVASPLVIESVLVSMGFSNVGHAIAWNDAPLRTKKQVIARLTKETPHAV